MSADGNRVGVAVPQARHATRGDCRNRNLVSNYTCINGLSPDNVFSGLSWVEKANFPLCLSAICPQDQQTRHGSQRAR